MQEEKPCLNCNERYPLCHKYCIKGHKAKTKHLVKQAKIKKQMQKVSGDLRVCEQDKIKRYTKR